MLSYFVLSLIVFSSLLTFGAPQVCMNCAFPMVLDVDGLCFLNKCSSGQYRAPASSTGCANCPTGCATCTSYTVCQTCKDGYTLQGSSCLLPSIASSSSSWVTGAAIGSVAGVGFVGLMVYIFKSKIFSAASKVRKLKMRSVRVSPQSPTTPDISSPSIDTALPNLTTTSGHARFYR